VPPLSPGDHTGSLLGVDHVPMRGDVYVCVCEFVTVGVRNLPIIKYSVYLDDKRQG